MGKIRLLRKSMVLLITGRDSFCWFRNFVLWAKALANINSHFTALIINSQINGSSEIWHDMDGSKVTQMTGSKAINIVIVCTLEKNGRSVSLFLVGICNIVILRPVLINHMWALQTQEGTWGLPGASYQPGKPIVDPSLTHWFIFKENSRNRHSAGKVGASSFIVMVGFITTSSRPGDFIPFVLSFLIYKICAWSQSVFS